METPKDYTVKAFKIGDFKDPNGNTWCEVLFNEYSSEPIKWVVKDPSTVSVGQVVYGHIEVKTSKADKPYNRFYRDQREVRSAPAHTPSHNSGVQTTDESIARSVALKAAVELETKNGTSPEVVLKVADTFLVWLQGNKPKLDATPDPMDKVFNPEEYQGDTTDLPPGW